MMHIRTSRLRNSVAAVALLTATSSLADEHTALSYVVVGSTAPAFTVGTLVEEDATLEVPQGASLTLIDAGGKIKIIEGPFLGRLRSEIEQDPESNSFLNDLADIIAKAETTEVALGLGRSSNLSPETNPWLVAFDESIGPDLCISPDGRLSFYRTEGTFPDLEAVRFGSADGTAEAQISWAIEDTLLAWPDALPPDDGGAYFIDPGAATQPTAVELHVAPADVATDAHMAVWLARSGCTIQAEAMVRRLALSG